MSVLSTVSTSLSTYKVYLYCALAGVLLALAGGAYLYVTTLEGTIDTQQKTITAKDGVIGEKDKTITNKDRDIQIVKDDRTEAISQLNSAQSQLSTLNQENEKNAASLEEYKQKNGQLLRNQIHLIQASDACSQSAIPAGAVRLWINAISEFNSQYSVPGASGGAGNTKEDLTRANVPVANNSNQQ